MESMASWEDGPEYAPVERPSEFAVAPAPPLEVVPAPERPTAGAPQDRPAFDGPRVPAPRLVDLVPVVADQRDPARPFDVVSSTLTSMDSAWGSAHWSAPNGAPAAGAVPLGAPTQPVPVPYPGAQPGPTGTHYPGPTGMSAASVVGYPPAPAGAPVVQTPYPGGPPAGANGQQPPAPAPYGDPAARSWPQPTAPIAPVTGPAQLPYGYPPPGTPQWFGPGPPAPQPRAAVGPVRFAEVTTAATPGLVICLVIGGVLWFLAPIMLGVGFFLSARVKVARESVRKVYLFALGFLGFFALAGLLNAPLGFGDWWSYVGIWSLVICWVLMATVLVLVHRGLKSGRAQPPSTMTGWPGA